MFKTIILTFTSLKAPAHSSSSCSHSHSNSSRSDPDDYDEDDNIKAHPQDARNEEETRPLLRYAYVKTARGEEQGQESGWGREHGSVGGKRENGEKRGKGGGEQGGEERVRAMLEAVNRKMRGGKKDDGDRGRAAGNMVVDWNPWVGEGR